MPKAKLTFKAIEEKKLQVAAHIAGITLGESIVLQDELHITVSYKDPQSLVKMGQVIEKVNGNEFDKPKKRK